MLRSVRFSLSLLLCSTSAFAASGEGELHMKFTSPFANGEYVVHFSKLGTRTEGSVAGHPGTVAMTKKDTPDVIYMIDDAAKSYSEMNIAEHRGHSTETYTVKKAGSDTIAGYKAEHVTITSSTGGIVEMWLNKDLYEMAKQFHANGPGMNSEGIMKALKDQGIVGVPVKIVSFMPGKEDQGKFEMQLVSVDHRAQPAALFEIPADYTKQDSAHGGVAGAHGGMTPEMRAALKEQMKNMTPEQREKIEKALGDQAP